MVLNQVHDAVQTTVHRTSILIFAAKILSQRFFLIFGHMHGMLHQLIHTLVFGGGNRHHRNAQQAFHLVNADTPPVVPHLIHHVQRQHHRHIQLHQLHSEVKVTVNVTGIHNVDYSLRRLLYYKISGNHLLGGIW